MNNPALYSRANPLQVRDASMALKAYLKDSKNIMEGDSILDIGCGSGNVTSQVLAPSFQNYSKIVGVDISEEMIHFAQEQFSEERIHYNVLDIAADVTDFRAFWGGFSKIFSFYCLHWIKDHRKALENIKYLMKAGGECLLVFVAQCPVFEMYEILAENTRWAEYMQDVNNFIPSTQHSLQPAFYFSQLMQNVGLHVMSCETVEQSFTFPSVHVLKDCMCAVNPFINRIPKEQQSDFITDCLRTLAVLRSQSTSDNENQGHSFGYKLLIARARKLGDTIQLMVNENEGRSAFSQTE